MLPTRRAFLLLFIGVTKHGHAEESYDQTRMKQHMAAVAELAVAFDEYVRRLFGCPNRRDWSAEMCDPKNGSPDIGLYNKCRKLSKKTWDL